MTLARMVGGAMLCAALGAGAVVVWLQPAVLVEAGGERSGGMLLKGFVEAPALDLSGFRVRCSPERLEAAPRIVLADLEMDGGFSFDALGDTDHRLELVWGDDPEVVLARRDWVRPGGDDVVIQVDPVLLAEWLHLAEQRTMTAASRTQE
jgi:hypothetical protein